MAISKKVLVVEDNWVAAQVVRYNLKRAGFDVVTCSNGQLATEMLTKELFDLIITDYQMPVMNGIDFCHQVRQDERHADVPIFMISAKGLELDVAFLTIDLSLAKVFFKPFSPRELMRSVREVLEPVTTQ